MEVSPFDRLLRALYKDNKEGAYLWEVMMKKTHGVED